MIGLREDEVGGMVYSARRPSMLIEEKTARDLQRLRRLARREKRAEQKDRLDGRGAGHSEA